MNRKEKIVKTEKYVDRYGIRRNLFHTNLDRVFYQVKPEDLRLVLNWEERKVESIYARYKRLDLEEAQIKAEQEINEETLSEYSDENPRKYTTSELGSLMLAI